MLGSYIGCFLSLPKFFQNPKFLNYNASFAEIHPICRSLTISDYLKCLCRRNYNFTLQLRTETAVKRRNILQKRTFSIVNEVGGVN